MVNRMLAAFAAETYEGKARDRERHFRERARRYRELARAEPTIELARRLAELAEEFDDRAALVRVRYAARTGVPLGGPAPDADAE